MGKVYLCGAGPGDLNFMSIRVKHLIEKCDVLIYDALVDTTILETTTAQTIYVGKRAGKHALAQEAINQLLIERENFYCCTLKRWRSLCVWSWR